MTDIKLPPQLHLTNVDALQAEAERNELASELRQAMDERDAAQAEVRELRAELARVREEARKEVERLRTDGASAVRWAPGSAYWSGVLRELFGPDARVGIDALEARWRAELERADTAEALLRQVLEVLGRAHHVAMEQTLKARIPECGEFAGIAQDIDFVVATLRERLGEKV